jgi:hypothetical protein
VLVWLVFAFEVAVMLAVSPDRLGWMRGHKPDVFIVSWRRHR